MTLPGKVGVGPTGAATYGIPIALPPGTAGVAPTLSLSYSSQGTNGLLGVGWSLGGLPSILRCAKTFSQDGVQGGINDDANDRFCLDGERLVAVSGAYGADGTEYRTEIDSYNKITSYGTQGNGPAWFEVRTKSGQVMQFGWTADSRILAQGKTTARHWALNKLSDTKGNNFSVAYTNDTATAQFYPIEIIYAGNAVRFVYETQPDSIQQYQAGSLMRTTVRLTNVKTFVGSTLVSDYRLAYQHGLATSRSRIGSVTACDGAGSCLPATTFGWQDALTVGEASLQYSEAGGNFGSPPGTGWSIINGDFNADGKTDYAMIGSTVRYVYLSSGDGYFALVISEPGGSFGWPPSTGWSVISGDFNGDGKTDYALLGSTSRYVYLSSGDGNFALVWSEYSGPTFGYPPNANWSVVEGDFNGDGKSDYALIGSEGRFVFLSTGDGYFATVYSGVDGIFGYPPSANWSVIGGDFNGDGKSDYALIGGDGRHVYLSSGDGTFTRHYTGTGGNFGYPPSSSWSVVGGDFNGDGKSDYALIGGDGRYAYLSNGDGSFTLQYSSGGGNFGYPPSTGWSIVGGDFNGDGKGDYALIGSGARYVYLSNGDGFFTQRYSSFGVQNFGSPPHANWAVVSGDFNGDGLSDFAMVGSSNRYVYTANGPMPDLLTSVTSGLGATTTITYVPATNSSVVTKGTGTGFPMIDLVGPIYVVSRIDAPNGAGGNYSWTYTYYGGRTDTRGRGFLGFELTSVKDLQTDIIESTTYRQDFPFIGLASTTRKSRYSLTLNQMTTSFQFSNAGGAASVSAPTLASAPYRVSVAQSVAQSTDLDGTAMPTMTTTFQYDAFGNATQVVTSTPDGFSKTTVNTYTNDTSQWLLGRLTRATVTSVAP